VGGGFDDGAGALFGFGGVGEGGAVFMKMPLPTKTASAPFTFARPRRQVYGMGLPLRAS